MRWLTTLLEGIPRLPDCLTKPHTEGKAAPNNSLCRRRRSARSAHKNQQACKFFLRVFCLRELQETTDALPRITMAYRWISLIVLDQNTPPRPILDSTMVPHEHVVYAGGQIVDNDICPSRVSTCQHTTTAGVFHDAPFGACGNTTFFITFTQDITINLGGASYPVRTNHFTTNSSSSGHGAITNGSDIAKTR